LFCTKKTFVFVNNNTSLRLRKIKTIKQLKMMKKLHFFFLLLPFWGLGGFSYAQSVKLLGEDFTSHEVTFFVDISPATSTWVIVEYTTTPHDPTNMSRATFTGSVTFTPSGAGSLAAENRGFWMTSSATVTAKLEDVSGKFSWCAYAFDAPPNAKVNPEGGYTLRGTPPFTINGNIEVSAGTFGPGTCIESITDFTYNPEGLIPDPPAVTVSASAFASETAPCANAAVTFTATASGGITDVMTYTWNIAGQTYSITSDTYSLALSTVNNATYSVRVVNANGCTSTVSNMGTVTMESVIETRTVNAILGYPPRTGIPKSLKASVCENTTYEWRRSGTDGDVTLMDSDELAYDIKKDVYAINTPGTYYYRRYATLTAGTIPVPAEGTYTLKVFAPPPSPAGTKTWRKEGSNVIWTAAIRVLRDGVNVKDRGENYGYHYGWIQNYNWSVFCPTPWLYPDVAQMDNAYFDWAWSEANGWQPAGIWKDEWVDRPAEISMQRQITSDRHWVLNWNQGNTYANTFSWSTLTGCYVQLRCYSNYDY
jgi:hypothetical protein